MSEEKKMTGFIRLADFYQQIVDKRSHEMTEEQIQKIKKEIKVLRIIGDMTQEEINLLFDSSAFNEIVLGYVARTCEDLDYSPIRKEDLIYGMKEQFENHNAEYALDYWSKLHLYH